MSGPAENLPDPPPSLDSESAAALSAHTEEALESQRRQLAESIDKAFNHIPWPLRTVVRRVLGA
jgi:hypothetical protein